MRLPISLLLLFLLLAGVYSLVPFRAGNRAFAAPIDTGKSVIVNILSARDAHGIRTDSGLMQRLTDSVVLQQGDTYLACDSAYLNLQTNNMEAFGNVHITQPGGTQVSADYLRYTGNKKLAYLKGNVNLTDSKSSLWSEDLTYDVAAKTGTYENGGTLQNDATTLSSNRGVYNTKTKDARFGGEVLVSDPQYSVTSEDLGYNTETKVVRFLAPSVVNNDKSELRTSSGFYDTKREIAHFTARSSIRNGPQYIEADTLDYNRISGSAIAQGKVFGEDTAQHATLWSGYASYNEISRQLFARIKPVLRNAGAHDTIYIRADTFYSALQEAVGVSNPKSQIPGQKTKDKRQKTKEGSTTTVQQLSNNRPTTVQPPADTTAPRFYIGYHHVRIWSDSLQGLCDSISYSAKDSLMKMMGAPVAWSRESQITGDTINLYTDSSRIRRLFVPNNALIVSRSGPVKAAIFDQVQGKTLTAFFKNNAVDYMVVFPAAESIYYSKDDAGRYLGVDQAESERMRVLFDDNKIRKIVFEQEVKHKMSPLDKVSLPAMRLSRFLWLEEKRPKGKGELFE